MRFGLFFLAACTPFTLLSNSSEARPPVSIDRGLMPLERQECFAQSREEKRMPSSGFGNRGSSVLRAPGPSSAGSATTKSSQAPTPPPSTTVAPASNEAPAPAVALDFEGVDEGSPGAIQNRPHPSTGQHLDWGATVYLSNDDSMSLASAQRVMAALERGFGLPPEHIRPHELLNYFSFKTDPVSSGKLFSVKSAAVQEGSTLTLGFAVQGRVRSVRPSI